MKSMANLVNIMMLMVLMVIMMKIIMITVTMVTWSHIAAARIPGSWIQGDPGTSPACSTLPQSDEDGDYHDCSYDYNNNDNNNTMINPGELEACSTLPHRGDHRDCSCDLIKLHY